MNGELPAVISSDFNADIQSEIEPYFKQNFKDFHYHIEKSEEVYNTENRV